MKDDIAHLARELVGEHGRFHAQRLCSLLDVDRTGPHRLQDLSRVRVRPGKKLAGDEKKISVEKKLPKICLLLWSACYIPSVLQVPKCLPTNGEIDFCGWRGIK